MWRHHSLVHRLAPALMLSAILQILLAPPAAAEQTHEPAQAATTETAPPAASSGGPETLSAPTAAKPTNHSEASPASRASHTPEDNREGREESSHQVHDLPLWSMIPFLLMLLSIAIFPLVAEDHWHPNQNKLIVSAILGIPVAGYILGTVGFVPLEHAVVEYFQFIMLLGSLYVISGGILVTGDIQATPRNNATFLVIGALLASFIGTTGAAMLLIRPLLSTNSERKHVVHTVVFFIFMVSNVGGCLTPLGDPPLFLGYLRNVPFTWTFSLWPEWLAINGILLTIYLIWDHFAYKSEEVRDLVLDKTIIRPIRARGLVNLILLGGVIVCVAFIPSINAAKHQIIPFRELGMLGLCLLSYALTEKGLRKANHFSFHAITEVAALFIGIFVTMVPALLILEARGAQLGVDSPMSFFWFTGALSSFLDNAPTYATFFELGKSVTSAGNLTPAIAGVWEPYLRAISLGAVFMGANTYIGNGPNFMVKSIAEHRGIKMPSFFGYMLYSMGILIPIYILLSLVIF